MTELMPKNGKNQGGTRATASVKSKLRLNEPPDEAEDAYDHDGDRPALRRAGRLA